MHKLTFDSNSVLEVLRPSNPIAALVYLALFIGVALFFSRALRALVHAAMTRRGHIDLTTISFVQQLGTALIWVIMIILYAHLIPVLRSMGTALLAGASIASVVIGLAAQSTLGNLVAGISITLYRPFHLGDKLQVAAPTGTETGSVEMISLGYTTLRTADGRLVVLPNSIAASQVTINLTQSAPKSQIKITIRVNRETDYEEVRRAALSVASETLGEKAAVGCFLSKVTSVRAIFELTAEVPESDDRDALRASMLSRLAQRFAASSIDSKGQNRASFS